MSYDDEDLKPDDYDKDADDADESAENVVPDSHLPAGENDDND